MDDFYILLLSCAGTALTAILSLFIAFVNSKKKYRELEAAKIELETEKVRLQQKIVDGSYIVCPSCGHQIYLKDVEVKIQKL